MRIGATSRKYACSTETISAHPSTKQNSSATSTGSSSSAGPNAPAQRERDRRQQRPRIAANVTSCTVTVEAGIASRGKRALRTSAPWSISDSAADQQRLLEERPHDAARPSGRSGSRGIGCTLEHVAEHQRVRAHQHERVDQVPEDPEPRALVLARAARAGTAARTGSGNRRTQGIIGSRAAASPGRR